MSSGFTALLLTLLAMGALGYGLSWLATLDSVETPSKQKTAQDESLARPDAQEDLGAGARGNGALIEQVNRCLPQTQCAQCGYPGCRPYAEAIINSGAPINQCPPGGEPLIAELANLLGTEPLPLDQEKGETKPAQVALIVERDCIGCALCIAACPVDAIVGASRYMHTVITEHCTGCELCLPPCPVDCIELHATDRPLQRWQWPKPE